MAQGDKFQLAVAYPLMNPSFSLQNRATGTLDTAYTSGTTLSTNGVSGDQGGSINFLDLIFKANDRIVVGPSTNATDINKQESALVSSFSGKVFTLAAALDFDYEISDNFSGIGSALAGGWYLSGAINSSTEADVVLGNFDNYAQKFIASNNIGGTLFLNQDLDSSFLEDSATHRFGFVYKFINDSPTGLFIVSIDGASDVLSQTTSFTSNTFIFSRTWSASPVLIFKLRNPGSIGALTATIDDVYLEHTFEDFESRRTIIPVTNDGFENGHYQFDENPDLNTLKITKRDVFKELTFSSGKKVWHDFSGEGDRVERYSFGCKFSNVSQSFYDVLLEFDRIQKEGNPMNIHPNIDDLPSVLTGRFKISGVEKNNWDLSLRSFNFEFMES